MWARSNFTASGLNAPPALPLVPITKAFFWNPTEPRYAAAVKDVGTISSAVTSMPRELNFPQYSCRDLDELLVRKSSRMPRARNAASVATVCGMSCL